MDMTETSGVCRIRKAAVVQTIAHISVRCEGVAGVLAVDASAAVRVSEILNGEVRLAGRESVELTVSSDGGLKKVGGWAEVSDRAEVEGIDPRTRAFAVCRVTDTDIVSVSGDNISLASVVEITVMTEETSVVPPVPAPSDGIYTNGESVRFSRLSARISGRAESGECERLPVTEVVCCNAGFASDVSEAALDAVFVSGRFVLDGVGKTAEGNLTPFTAEIPVSCEIPAEGVRRGDVVYLRTGAVGVSESRGENGVTLSASVELSGEAYCEFSAAVVTDAFSPTHELELERTDVYGMLVRGSYSLTDRTEGSVELPEGDNADKITAVTGARITALTAYAENGKAVIEGAAACCVVYSDAEAGRRGSCNAELPFRITTDIDAADGETPMTDGCVVSVSARPARRGEITVSCTICFKVLSAADVHVSPVTAVKSAAEKPDRTGVLSMHSAFGGETLWECSKSLSVSPDEVLAQNRGLEFPLSKGEKVFVFRSAGR